MQAPSPRLRTVNDLPIRAERALVLYWMTSARRTGFNFGLQHAANVARSLKKPVVVFEPLRVHYRWANDRLHRFIIEGMRDNAAALAKVNVAYYPYVEPKTGAGEGLLAAFAKLSCVVVTDDYPAFFLPALLRIAAREVDCQLQAVDSNGLLPMRAAPSTFSTAHSFRRFLQKSLAPHLAARPDARPLSGGRWPPAPDLTKLRKRWPPLTSADLSDPGRLVARLPIDHDVQPGPIVGGAKAGGKALARMLDDRLASYPLQRNEPDEDGSSGLSPYLHFGHVAAHEVFAELIAREGWTPERLAAKPNGSREGWWGMSSAAEAFCDQFITWRELGFNLCWQCPDYDKFRSLPDWAKLTLTKHAKDRREHRYELEDFEQAATHDPLWNAAQRQLVRDGRLHNYLRMLWGKKILQWSASPQDALRILIHLNNKYALDGRDPNSYSGIFWTLGRFDRPWGPERPIFGKVRYMTSENTARKFSVSKFLAKYGA